MNLSECVSLDVYNVYISTCAQNIVVAALPFVFCVIFGIPWTLWLMYSSKFHGGPVTWVLTLKLIACGALVSILLLELVTERSWRTFPELFRTGMLVCSLTASAAIMLVERRLASSFFQAALHLLLLGVCAIRVHFSERPVFPGIILGLQCLLVVLCVMCRDVENSQMCGEPHQSVLSRISFSWMTQLARRGFSSQLSHDSLVSLMPDERAAALIPRFNELWSSHSHRSPATRLALTALGLGGSRLLIGSCLKIVFDALSMLSPVLVRLFLDFMTDSSIPVAHGFLLAAALLSVTTVASCVLHQYFFNTLVGVLRIRSALSQAIYEKALRLSAFGRQQTTVGATTNLLASDVEAINRAGPFINMIWSAPVQIIIINILLVNLMGPSVFYGVLLMVASIFLSAFIAQRQRSFERQRLTFKDERMRLVNETFVGIRVVKLFALERAFHAKLGALRAREIALIWKTRLVAALSSLLWGFTPQAVSVLVFYTYLAADPSHKLDPSKAFVSSLLFNMLRFPLVMLPGMIVSLVMMSVSLRRLANFLLLPQIKTVASPIKTVASPIKTDSTPLLNNHSSSDSPSDCSRDVVELSHASFSWGQLGDEDVLHDICLRVRRGWLVAVVGPVGAGKSSLVEAVLGELTRTQGEMSVRAERVAYVAQEAWIRHASVRQNIEVEPTASNHEYLRVIEACALTDDLALLPDGDATEIGEKGINLSGGQRQRIALARAALSKPDLVLLDAPLAAVDAHVAKHLFSRVIAGPRACLKDATRLWVTHRLHFVAQADWIVFMDQGRVQAQGDFAHLKATCPAFDTMMQSFGATGESLEDTPERKEPETRESGRGGTLVAEEASRVGAVSLRVVKELVNSLHPVLFVSVVTLIFGAAALRLSADMTLRQWTNTLSVAGNLTAANLTAANLTAGNLTAGNLSAANLTAGNLTAGNLTDPGLFGRYAALSGAQGVVTLCGSVCLAFAIVRGARFWHDRLVFSQLRCVLHHFDSTPIGRILNRFSKDMEVIDQSLGENISGVLFCLTNVMATFVIIIAVLPLYSVVLLPLTVFYALMQRLYVSSARQIQRLESVSRSPILSHLAETFAGLTTIRAFRKTASFRDRMRDLVNSNQRAMYTTLVLNRWLAMRIEMIANSLTFGVALYCVLRRDVVLGGSAGISLLYAVSVTQLLNFFVRLSSEMETNLVAVERIADFCGLASEAAWDAETARPESGDLVLDSLCVRYRADLPLVLNHVSFKVAHGEKIGIVGRTGSGKSTLALALFRAVEPASGTIWIGGVDFTTLGLHQLRSSIAIIPQEPVIFTDTVRFNLDPAGLHSDVKLWDVLKHVQLEAQIKAMGGGLDLMLAENGSNLSAGHRQLLCFGRALLSDQTKVVVLDEATSSIDVETDTLIQRMIRKELSDKTVITIAHRLETIVDYDKVAVFGEGRLVEFGSPRQLAHTPNSVFGAMVAAAGLKL